MVPRHLQPKHQRSGLSKFLQTEQKARRTQRPSRLSYANVSETTLAMHEHLASTGTPGDERARIEIPALAKMPRDTA
jgi:hypothetical protein